MKEDRQKYLETRVERLTEQVSMIMENSKHMESSFNKRIKQVEHDVLDLPENYDDIEEDDTLQGKF